MPHVTHVEWPAGDADRLQEFLQGLFGWQFENVMEGMDYRMARTAENEGAAVFPSEESERSPLVYYDVDDIESSVAKARELGGEADEKMAVPAMGWFSICRSPEGNRFGLWQTDSSASPPEG